MKTVTINMKGDTAEVLLYDQIGRNSFFEEGIDAKTFRDQIKAVKAKTLNLRVNSPGGDVFEAAAMLQALDEFPGQIEVDIDGLAASAASYVIMAGDTIRVANNGMLMIHNPSAIVWGSASEMLRMADLLTKVKGQILDTYQRKASASRDQLSVWMDAETWLTGQEAVDAGLADEVAAAVPVTNLAGHANALRKLGCKNTPAFTALQAQALEETRKRQEIAARLCVR